MTSMWRSPFLKRTIGMLFVVAKLRTASLKRFPIFSMMAGEAIGIFR
ncbi:hypothetical protein FEAC_16220 [Ferrimicrobium acidiphilum DSM 19497]|uniref:Uncharacterized protein n=1 Tax=Ferrimicrobium acidiphilum DSM 19497 TaxID=1121877 RepID=A0A0D8FTT4_9ACTN|nr:hypothetical protein FEAC_16220 [Ferrimicrobium acidiphilum DSM 19497]